MIITFYAMSNKLTNRIFYIGNTVNLYNRIKSHKSCYKRNVNLRVYNYIKYVIGSWENVEFIVLKEIDTTKSKAIEIEDELIELYETKGVGNKVKNSEMHYKGWKHSDETKKKLSEKAKGKNNYSKLSPEKYKKVCEKLKGKNNPSARSVLVYSLDGNTLLYEFDTMEEACVMLGVSKGNVCNVCKGKRKSTGGYIFKYKEGESDD